LLVVESIDLLPVKRWRLALTGVQSVRDHDRHLRPRADAEFSFFEVGGRPHRSSGRRFGFLAAEAAIFYGNEVSTSWLLNDGLRLALYRRDFPRGRVGGVADAT
jgi:hypothetical protein